jgi:hypothetical protein
VAVRVVLHPAHRGGPLPQGTIVWGAEQFWTIAIGSLEPCANQTLSYFLTVGVEGAEAQVVLQLASPCHDYAPECVLTAALSIVRRQRSPNV